MPRPTHSRKWKGSKQREEVACLIRQPAKHVTAPTQGPRETEAEGRGGLKSRAPTPTAIGEVPQCNVICPLTADRVMLRCPWNLPWGHTQATE